MGTKSRIEERSLSLKESMSLSLSLGNMSFYLGLRGLQMSLQFLKWLVLFEP